MKNEILASDIVNSIILDLRDRKGFDDLYDSLDDDVKFEIGEKWEEIIVDILNKGNK